MLPRAHILTALVVLLPVLAYWPVALGSPVIFGDEGFFAALGRYTAQTGSYPVWDPYISTDAMLQPNFRQPLYTMVVSGLLMVGGETALKFFIPLFALLAALALYLLLKRTVGPVAGAAGGLVLLGTMGFVTYGVLNYVEVFNVLLLTLAVLFAATGRTDRHWVAAGMFVGLSFMTDTTGLFALPLVAAVLVMQKRRAAIRPLLLAALAAALVAAPWILHNVLLYGSPCIFLVNSAGCAPHALVEIAVTQQVFQGDVVQVGSNQGIQRIGWLNYFNFAFGLPVLVLMLFGIAALANEKRAWPFLLPWFFLFLLVTFQQGFWGSRAEDAPRYTLFAFPAVAAMGGLLVAGAYDYVARWHRWLGPVVIIVLLLALWPGISDKLATMQQIKAFAPGFFEGCQWVMSNTATDARIFTIYQHHMTWACDRAGFSPGEVPDGAAIALSNDDTSWEHLKIHGADYVMIAQFTVNQQALQETTTPAFINYLESSTHFRKVYDNTARFGNSGVRIYEVL